MVGLGEGYRVGLLVSRDQDGSVTVSSTGFFIVMASLLIGAPAVRDSGYRGYCQCCGQYQGDDFHDALPVVIEKLQIPAAPNYSAQNAVFVDFFVGQLSVWVLGLVRIVTADDPAAITRSNQALYDTAFQVAHYKNLAI